jgi:hypothetical protein
LEYEKSLFTSTYFTNLTSLTLISDESPALLASFKNNVHALMAQCEGERLPLPITILPLANCRDETAEPQLGAPDSSAVLILGGAQLTSRGKMVTLRNYLAEFINLKHGRFLLLRGSGSIGGQSANPDKIILPDREAQKTIDEVLKRIQTNDDFTGPVSELAGHIRGYQISGVILGCLGFNSIASAIEEACEGLEIIDIIKIVTYDIVDSWRANNTLEIMQSGNTRHTVSYERCDFSKISST